MSKHHEYAQAKCREIVGYPENFKYLYDDTTVDIEIGAMYRRPDLGLKRLKDLSELFHTDDISQDEFSLEGCETCDYGSNYGWNIRIRNYRIELPTETN